MSENSIKIRKAAKAAFEEELQRVVSGNEKAVSDSDYNAYRKGFQAGVRWMRCMTRDGVWEEQA